VYSSANGSDRSIGPCRLSRRRALALAGATGAMLASRPAAAQERPTADRAAALQGAGFYRKPVGTIETVLVSDGAFAFNPPYPLFGANAGEAQVRAALEREFIPYDRVMGQVNAFVIRTPNDLILVDTGCGTLFGPTTGRLTANLANAGLTPAQVTAVVLTHAHGDHIGMLAGDAGPAAFPNAKYFVHADEMAFWTGATPDLSRSGVPEASRAGMVTMAAGVLKAIEPKATLLRDGAMHIADGVEAVALPGHTPGHIGVVVQSGGQKLLYIADLIHHYAMLMPHPEWHVAFDTDLDAAARARRALLERASAERLPISGAHLPFPAVGHVRVAGDGFAWVPSVWEW
jgi:glyoxylase-like metal-dependent hydrolase (beta-lactamase superfamily II)